MLDLPAWTRKAWFNTPETSAYLDIAHGITCAPATLEKRRCVGGNPKFHKHSSSRNIRYARADVDAWAADQLGAPLKSTSAVA